MALILGVLGDSYRRQLRHLSDRAPIDAVIEKVAALSQEFNIRPIGVDFSVGQLASKDEAYLDELKDRLDELDMAPTVIVGTLNLTADRGLSGPALDDSIGNIEVAHRLGSPLGLFYFTYGGRVTREGRIRLAIEQISLLARAALSYDMRVTTENFDFFTSDDFIEIFEGVGLENVGLHSDTGNWLMLGEDPLEAVREHGSLPTTPTCATICCGMEYTSASPSGRVSWTSRLSWMSLREWASSATGWCSL